MNSTTIFPATNYPENVTAELLPYSSRADERQVPPYAAKLLRCVFFVFNKLFACGCKKIC